MATPPRLHSSEAIADKEGKPTASYVKFFSRFTSALTDQIDSIAQALADIVTLQDSTGSLWATKADKVTQILGVGSIIGGGDLSTDKYLSLENDSDAPGVSYLYGTDASGVRGWYPGTGYGTGGTVTSVALSLPAIFSVSGSPVTGAGTLTGSLANQSANLVWAGPSTGSAAAPTFRSLVNADLPTVASSKGGTGFTTYATGDLIYASAANTLSKLAAGSNGYVLTLAAGVPTWAAAASGSSTVPVITDSTTARTAVLTDADKLIEFTNAAAITYTVPKQATVAWTGNEVLYAAQGAAGQVTFVADTGVTIETPDTLKSRSQESIIGVKRMASDRWEAFGDLETSVSAASVFGRAAATTGAPAAIVSTADGQVVVRRSGVVGFGTLAAADVSLGNVTNDAQTKAAIVPNTAPAAGEVLVGNAGGTAYAKQAISGDATLTSAGVLTIGAAKVGLSKIANASASSKLLGSGASGSGASYAEITLGSGLTMTGTTLSASGGGGGSGSVSEALLGGNLTVSTTSDTDIVTISLAAGTYYVMVNLTIGIASAQTPDFYITDGTTYYSAITFSLATAGNISALGYGAVITLGSTTTVKAVVRPQVSTTMTYYAATLRGSKAGACRIMAVKVA